MAQTPSKIFNDNVIVDWDQGTDADRKNWEVVVFGNKPGFINHAIDYSETPRGSIDFTPRVLDMPQAAEVLTAEDVVYWDEDGDPVTGDTGSGAVTATSTGNKLLGCVAPIQPNGTNATEATDSYVRVMYDPSWPTS